MWQDEWQDPLQTFLGEFDDLIGDGRTRTTFAAVVQGILASGTTLCSQIASHSPELAGRYGEERVRRFVKGDTRRSSPNLDPPEISTRLREHTLAHLQAAAPREVWLIFDGSAFRKPHARQMPYLQKVPALPKAPCAAIPP